jgi:colanic acid biosynthesis glycosyl transferase WcaI
MAENRSRGSSPLDPSPWEPPEGGSLRVQLWSYNYDPEPTGIGPVSKVLAEGLRDRGHSVEVVAAHPHYPLPKWGNRRLPYREVRNGIPVLRLPLWVGRATTMERVRQELTYMGSLTAALPALRRPDVIVSASPSFPALLPAVVNVRLRGIPWVLWLHDILPDGAATTGIVRSGLVLDMSRRLERAAYREADRIVVLSRAFTDNLARKGVLPEKVELIYDPATRIPTRAATAGAGPSTPRLLSMGNIGFSQGLAPLVEAYERSDAIRDKGIELVITGDGVAAQGVRDRVRSDRVQMIGVVDDERLEEEFDKATIAVVTQHYEGGEFNIPSKLMNFMAYGLPILAAVNPQGEVARLVEEAGAGWVVDSSDPDAFPRKAAELAESPQEVAERGRAARAYAERHFTKEGFAERFERSLKDTVAKAATAPGRP